MKASIEELVQVSDGVVVQFNNGTACYFPADFLLEQAGLPSTQILVRHEPEWASAPGVALAEEAEARLSAN